ncbi:MAG: hypothetical protein WAK48_12420 [Candidatus Acidiferrum sp.]
MTDTAKDKHRGNIRTLLLLVWAFLRKNLISLLALIVSVISLRTALIDRQEAREQKQLATTTMTETIESAPAAIEYALPKYQYAPFRGPYLLLPVRIFTMNDTSLPQSVVGVWISFDDEGPEDKIKYVELEDVTQTNGDKLSWPKTLAPWETFGFDAIVPVPIDDAIASQLGADAKKHHHVDLGPAGQLRLKLPTGVVDKMTRTVRFNIRLLSPSPGHPNYMTLKTELPR